MPTRGLGLINRAAPGAVALETTLLVHGMPRAEALPLFRDLSKIVADEGASAALAGVVGGTPIVGMTEAELQAMLDAPATEKASTGNLGVLIHRGVHAATTVSATMELASAAGLSVLATGGIGGVHRGYGERWDVSADLAAMARFPIVVVASGVKAILDVPATREALETLGVPVVGFRTDRFPAFYLSDGGAGVDARFDDEADLARFVRRELARAGRGVLVANPVPRGDEIDAGRFAGWLAEAQTRVRAAGVHGRDATPFILACLHELSGGATLRANLALVKSNARLAARLAREQ